MTDPSGKKPRGTLAEAGITAEPTYTDAEKAAQGTEDPSADPTSGRCPDPGTEWSTDAQDCVPMKSGPQDIYAAPAGQINESLDDWYRGTLYERLLKEWVKK